MAKIRTTSHHGRQGSAVHNGRAFDPDKAPHIDPAKSAGNAYYCFDQPAHFDTMTEQEQAEFFAGSDLRFYSWLFSASLEQQNEKYRERRQYSRIKTMENVVANAQTRPEETILQIGGKDYAGKIDRDTLLACVEDYREIERAWSEAHGGCVQEISIALHVDEASPHIHQRNVFCYQDENYIWHIGQEEALTRAGVTLPDPSKPKGRFNNRKMTYDAMRRQWWIDVCRQHGYDVDAEPEKHKRKHMDTETYKAHAAVEADRAALEAERAAVALERAKLDRLRQTAEEALKTALEATSEAQAAIASVKQYMGSQAAAQMAAKLTRADALKAQQERLRRHGLSLPSTQTGSDYQLGG